MDNLLNLPSVVQFAIFLITALIVLFIGLFIVFYVFEIEEEEYIALHSKRDDFHQPVIDLQQKYMRKGFIRGYQCKKLYDLQKKINKENSMTMARDLLK